MINIIVTGLFRSNGLDDSNQALLSSYHQPLTATCVEQAVTAENARLFLFPRNLLYLLVFVTSALWPAGASVVAGNAVSPKT
jgi:hypothetical protein